MEIELKAELKEQCKVLGLSTDIKFAWYMPPEQETSATSAIAMVCNGNQNLPFASLQSSFAHLRYSQYNKSKKNMWSVTTKPAIKQTQSENVLVLTR